MPAPGFLQAQRPPTRLIAVGVEARQPIIKDGIGLLEGEGQGSALECLDEFLPCRLLDNAARCGGAHADVCHYAKYPLPSNIAAGGGLPKLSH